MREVVYNSCFGGFSLSEEAVRRYFELKGWDLVVVKDSSICEFHFKGPIGAYNDVDDLFSKYEDRYWYDRDVDREDPTLVQVVKELGAKADGSYARLSIAEVNGPYRIDEYDGLETVMTPSDYNWR